MKIQRCYTKTEKPAYENIAFRRADSEIRNPDGEVIFGLKGFEIPKEWSQVASDIIAQKYFRKAGVPSRLKSVEEKGVPKWLWRKEADLEALAKLPEGERYGPEKSVKQVFNRLAGTWTYWGRKGGYFNEERDAKAFLHQSLSTPCVSTIKTAEGIWIEDLDGNRYMDFHGNSVHHIGYGHPKLKQAIKDQLDS